MIFFPLQTTSQWSHRRHRCEYVCVHNRMLKKGNQGKTDNFIYLLYYFFLNIRNACLCSHNSFAAFQPLTSPDKNKNHNYFGATVRPDLWDVVVTM